MANTEGLAVGLAVGVPSFVILTFVLILWLRNQRKQRREDQSQDDYDLRLREDESFGRFQEELHRPYQKEEAQADPNKSTSTAQGTDPAEKPYGSSNGSSTSTTTIEHHPQGSIHPPKSVHNRSPAKSRSAYDFYDSFIPVLHQSSVPNSSSTLQEVAPPAHDLESTNASSNNISIVGSTLPREKSLDNLAKQLTGPAFFEKLPSRAATVSLKQRAPGSQVITANNSSSDLLGLTINEHSTINDNFVYEAPKVDAKDDEKPHIPKSSATGALSHVLSGQIENSFDKDAGMTANSPFKDAEAAEEPEQTVVFQ